MNVYDFDGTIYKGDSSIDFYFFCLKNEPRIISSVFHQGKGILLYKLGKIDKTSMKEYYFSFLTKMRDPDQAVSDFWDTHYGHIKDWYLSRHEADDVIISASPSFLLNEACKRIGVKNLIASDVDIKSGKFHSPNCHDQIKAKCFSKIFSGEKIEEFYSDSLSDNPLAKMSEKAYWLYRGKWIPWPPICEMR